MHSIHNRHMMRIFLNFFIIAIILVRFRLYNENPGGCFTNSDGLSDRASDHSAMDK